MASYQSPDQSNEHRPKDLWTLLCTANHLALFVAHASLLAAVRGSSGRGVRFIRLRFSAIGRWLEAVGLSLVQAPFEVQPSCLSQCLFNRLASPAFSHRCYISRDNLLACNRSQDISEQQTRTALPLHMASVSVDISVNASFSYHGQNASTEILFGELNSAHNSTLSGYWINYPTPWPYLLISVAISIGLGWLGFRSSAKSWRPVHKRGQQHQLLPPSDIEMPTRHDDSTVAETEPQPQYYTDTKDHGFFKGIIARGERMKGMSKEERRAFLKDKNKNPAVDAGRAATAEYASMGQSFDLADDIRPDGGVG